MDGVAFHTIEEEDTGVPGWRTVPVTLKQVDTGEERKFQLVAGLLGIKPGKPVETGVQLEDEIERPAANGSVVNSVQPFVAWCIYEEAELAPV